MKTEIKFDSISPSSIAGIIKSYEYPKYFTENTIEIAKDVVKSLSGFSKKLRKNLFNYIIPEFTDQESLRAPKRKYWRISLRRLACAELDSLDLKLTLESVNKDVITTFDGHDLEDFFTGKAKIKEERLSEFRKVLLKNEITSYSLSSLFISLATNIFFALEYHCKDICSTACLKFAIQVANNEPIQHEEVWKCLKRLGSEKNNYACRICRIKKECKYDFDFDKMAMLYSAVIQSRMICDYTEEIVFQTKFGAYIYGCLFLICKSFILKSQKELAKALKSFLWAPQTYEDVLNSIKAKDI